MFVFHKDSVKCFRACTHFTYKTKYIEKPVKSLNFIKKIGNPQAIK